MRKLQKALKVNASQGLQMWPI